MLFTFFDVFATRRAFKIAVEDIAEILKKLVDDDRLLIIKMMKALTNSPEDLIVPILDLFENVPEDHGELENSLASLAIKYEESAKIHKESSAFALTKSQSSNVHVLLSDKLPNLAGMSLTDLPNSNNTSRAATPAVNVTSSQSNLSKAAPAILQETRQDPRMDNSDDSAWSGSEGNDNASQIPPPPYSTAPMSPPRMPNPTPRLVMQHSAGSLAASAPARINGNRITVTAFLEFLREKSFSVVFEFAVTLYSSQPSMLRDADGDLRKYLFHIARHTAVISGVAKVPVDGVSAGVFLFRIGAHCESIPDVRFKTLVREYLSFLEHINIRKVDGTVVEFNDSKAVIAQLNYVDFPGGLSFPIAAQVKDHAQTRAAAAVTRPYDGKDSSLDPATGESLLRQPPTINVRELHRRQLCVACRHYLRGMCYRGDQCNFCHSPEHQEQLERSTKELSGGSGDGMSGGSKSTSGSNSGGTKK